MTRTVLLPLDGSSLAERALPYAAHLASVSGARLVMMHGQPPVAAPGAPQFDVQAFAQLVREEQAVGALSDPRRIQIDAVTSTVYTDKTAEGICATARELGADAIVMSTHGKSGPGRWLYGTIADQVLRQATVPVILVSALCDHQWTGQAPFRILVPLDGSTFAEEVIAPVSDLARTLDAELHLIGAVSNHGETHAEGLSSLQSGTDAEIRAMHDYLDRVAARLRADGRTVHVDVEAGIAPTIIDEATRRRHIDLVAMATHGRSGVARLALGSVASQTLQRTTVPMFLVRPRLSIQSTGPLAAARA